MRRPQCTFKPFISIAASVTSRQPFPLDHQLFIIKRPLADPPPDFSDLMTFRSAEPGLAAHPTFALSFRFCSSRISLVFIPNSRTWGWNCPCPPWNIDEHSLTRRSCLKGGKVWSSSPDCFLSLLRVSDRFVSLAANFRHVCLTTWIWL